MALETVSGLKTIKASKDLYEDEEYCERVDHELDELLSRLIKKRKIDQKKVKKVVERYTDAIGSLLTKLEQEKRRVESQAQTELQNVDELISIEQGINSPRIKEKLSQLRDVIDDVSSRLVNVERREVRGRSPLGYALKKARGKKRILGDATKRIMRITRSSDPEQALFLRIKQRLAELADSKEPLKKLIEDDIIKLIELYIRNISDILQIVVDFDIEEAERLHKIEQYRKFLDQLGIKEYDGQLNNLRQRAIIWVYQDFQQEKDMQAFASRVTHMIDLASAKKTSKMFELSNIHVVPEVIGGLRGSLYLRDKQKHYAKGIVVAHGIWTERHNMDIVNRRLANEGFLVFTFDMPGHGKSVEELNLGLASEYVHQSILYLKSLGCNHIGVLGDSLGAMAGILSSLGYDRQVEQEVYSLMERYLLLVSRMGDTGVTEQDGERIQDYHQRIEQIILKSLERTEASRAVVDSYLFISAPLKFQKCVPRTVIRLLGYLPSQLILTKIVQNIKESSRLLKTTDKKALVNYIATCNGPMDYISLLDRFSQDSAPIRDMFHNILGRPPKLFLIGGLDLMLLVGVLYYWRLKTMYKIFRKLGNVEIRFHPFEGHWFSGIRFFKYNQVAVKPKISREIIDFFKSTL